MEPINSILQTSRIEHWLTTILVNKSELLIVGNGLTLVVVFVLGSSFWQATKRIREENEHFMPMIETIYSWKTDTLLLTYIVLLSTLIGLIVFISHSPVSDYMFWIGFLLVIAGQLTAVGQRMGRHLLGLFEAIFRSFNQAVS